MKGLETTVAIQQENPPNQRSNSSTEKVKIKIPAGVNTGSRIRVAGKGYPGWNGGQPGDLYILTNVQPHRLFERRGDNLYLEIPITISEAGLGGKIEVPSLEGKVLLKIPPGTASGKSFRLREKGCPRLKGGGRGDLFVKVQIIFPETLSIRSREILQEFAQLNPENPRTDLGVPS